MKVDFLEIIYPSFFSFKKLSFQRIQFDDIDPNLLPRKGDLVQIGSSNFVVNSLKFFPFGDDNGQKGVLVYMDRIKK